VDQPKPGSVYITTATRSRPSTGCSGTGAGTGWWSSASAGWRWARRWPPASTSRRSTTWRPWSWRWSNATSGYSRAGIHQTQP